MLDTRRLRCRSAQPQQPYHQRWPPLLVAPSASASPSFCWLFHVAMLILVLQPQITVDFAAAAAAAAAPTVRHDDAPKPLMTTPGLRIARLHFTIDPPGSGDGNFRVVAPAPSSEALLQGSEGILNNAPRTTAERRRRLQQLLLAASGGTPSGRDGNSDGFVLNMYDRAEMIGQPSVQPGQSILASRNPQ
ncbi:hypothetical protein VaNZ11_004666, partial [Volvox africanus]